MAPTAALRTTPSRRLRRLAAAAAAAALTLGLLAAGEQPESSATAKPPAAAVVPSGIEDLAAYVPSNSCTPRARAGTVALGRLLVATYPGTSFGGARACPASPNSEHHDGRAVDWMNSVRNAKQKKQGKAVVDWLLATDAQGNRYANARRLGVMYVIWNNRIWGAYNPEAGWREYNGCLAKSKQARSLDAACHRNHIHISLSWAGATGRTSYWTGRVAAPDYGRCRPADMTWATGYRSPNPVPCRRVGRPTTPKHASKTLKTLISYSGRGVGEGSTIGAVKAIQKTIGVTQTGTYSASTLAAMKTWQREHDLDPSGKLNYATWRALEHSIWPKNDRQSHPALVGRLEPSDPASRSGL